MNNPIQDEQRRIVAYLDSVQALLPSHAGVAVRKRGGVGGAATVRAG